MKLFSYTRHPRRAVVFGWPLAIPLFIFPAAVGWVTILDWIF